MASTTFVDGTTVIYAAWLNDVNTATYTTLPALSASFTTYTGTTLPALLTGYVQKTAAAALLPYGTTGTQGSDVTIGQLRYDTTLGKWRGYGNSGWGSIGGGATGGGSDAVFVETGQNVTADYTLTTGYNAMSAGPVTINTGVTVTVPTGAVWTVV